MKNQQNQNKTEEVGETARTISSLKTWVNPQTGEPMKEYIIKSADPEIQTFIPTGKLDERTGKVIYRLQDKQQLNSTEYEKRE